MNIDSSQIIWLFYQSGFGGDQLYYLLNKTGHFAYPINQWTKLDSKGKRYVHDLFDSNFHFHPFIGSDNLLKWNCSDWQSLKLILEHYLSRYNNLNLDKPIIIKGHVYFSELEIRKMAPNSKIIYINTDNDPGDYFRLALHKNQGLPGFPNLDYDDQIKFYRITVSKLRSYYRHGFEILAEDYFSNSLIMWQALSKYLGIDLTSCHLEHAEYANIHKYYFEQQHALTRNTA